MFSFDDVIMMTNGERKVYKLMYHTMMPFTPEYNIIIDRSDSRNDYRESVSPSISKIADITQFDADLDPLRDMISDVN